MTLNKIKKNSGFTIIEALIAIFILSVSVVSMLGMTSKSTSSARYANNEITANYLLQEAIDSVRNSRDTIAFQKKEDASLGGWSKFLGRYGYPASKCFSAAGCYLETEKFNPEDINGGDIKTCTDIITSENPTGCPMLSYDGELTSAIFYIYKDLDPSPSIFSRKVTFKEVNSDEIKVTAEVSWSNGNGTTPKTQKLEISLLNWIND